MAIQFDCPYCTSAIRVSDAAAGKKGSCPKCGTAVVVPQVAAPAPPPTPEPEPPGEALPQIQTGKKRKRIVKVKKKVKKKVVKKADGTTETVTTAEQPAPEMAFAAPYVEEVQPGTEGEKEVAYKRSVYAPRRKSGWPRVVVPLVCGAILVGGVGYAFWFFQKKAKLEGELEQPRVEHVATKPVTIPRSILKADSDTLDSALSGLEEKPIELRSSNNMLVVTISGSESGLVVQLRPGRGGHWYRVDLEGDDNLRKYVRANRGKWEKQRAKENDAAASRFVKEWVKAEEKNSQIKDLLGYRNKLGLNSLVGGFGYVVEARSGQTLHRCVYEDNEGRIYFLMPKSTKSFTLKGRKMADGSTPFAGKFKVSVSGTEAGDARPDEGEGTGSKTVTPGLSERGEENEEKDENGEMKEEMKLDDDE